MAAAFAAGLAAGFAVGLAAGSAEGEAVGFTVGFAVGFAVGEADAAGDGDAVSGREEPDPSAGEPQAEKIRRQSARPSRQDRKLFIFTTLTTPIT